MKKDKFLGEEVNLFLIKKGVETPQIKNDLTTDEKRRSIANHFYSIMGALGLDLSDDSLVDTPNRVAKMFVDEMFYGLNYNNFPKCTAVDNKMKYDEMVTVDKISLSSSCEHHFVIIDGFASVAYIPKDRVIGLSKINRIVDFFAKRPQIQERLTEQIFFALSYILETEDIAVKIKATHYCVKARGVKDVTSNTTTTKLGGAFKDPIAKNEFLLLTT
tara:strand:+ start:266 stop:916 length:651 start_codon:yes stop_codon:yes gene_type:complete